MRGIRPIVAVIEADAAARRTLCSLLSSLDAEIQDYDSAESFLASEPDAPGCGTAGCVITDILLPGMSGLELADYVKVLNPRITIILMTGFSEAIETGHAVDLPVLMKPFTTQSLTETFTMASIAKDGTTA